MEHLYKGINQLNSEHIDSMRVLAVGIASRPWDVHQ